MKCEEEAPFIDFHVSSWKNTNRLSLFQQPPVSPRVGKDDKRIPDGVFAYVPRLNTEPGGSMLLGGGVEGRSWGGVSGVEVCGFRFIPLLPEPSGGGLDRCHDQSWLPWLVVSELGGVEGEREREREPDRRGIV